MIGRLKFDIGPLVNEMLDQLPQELFESKVTTFLDPCMAGGQFVAAIERRLRSAGHSDKNIARRVHGFESNQMRINYAINKHKLVGNYQALDFLELDMKKKFDVTLGNPPYQSGTASRGNKLWPKFILKSVEITKPGGYVSLVTPTGWTSGGNNLPGNKGVISHVFEKEQLVSAHFDQINEKYFPKIGIDICWWTLKRETVSRETLLHLGGSIQKVDFRKTPFIGSKLTAIDLGIARKFFFGRQRRMPVVSFDRKIKKGSVEESTTPNQAFPYKHWVLGGQSAANEVFIYLNHKNAENLWYPKVVFTIGNRYWQPYYDLEGIGVAAQGYAVPLTGDETVESLKSIFEHPIFIYVSFYYQLQMKGFMKTNMVQHYPLFDLSKVWEIDELYKEIGITKKEKQHIEQVLSAGNPTGSRVA